MKPKFIICSPAYSHQSAGVSVLHNLCDRLNRLGYPTAIIFFGQVEPATVPPTWHYVCSDVATLYNPAFERVQLPVVDPGAAVKEFLEDGIAIYPEGIKDNPLGAKRIVRYVLIHTPPFPPVGNEYILAYSRLFYEEPQRILTQPLFDEHMHDRGARPWHERSMDLTYIGKGANFVQCSVLPDSVLLTRTWPSDKNQLGILLRQCRYFFTWDSVSSTNFDALLCGAVPVFLQDKQISKEARDNFEFGAFPDISLTDVNDKNSLKFDPVAVDVSMKLTRESIRARQALWPQQVDEFARDAQRFFNMPE